MNLLYNQRLPFSALLFIVLFVVTWPLYQYVSDLDAIGYMEVAHHYIEGDLKLAVNGFWNPLHSWLVIPLIKACLNAYASQGLRLIEVDKEDLTDLPDIVDVVAGRPEKFIIFCDDLSFEDGEPGYKALKSILDGSVAAATPNVLIYATSNRRHLLPEYMKENLTYTHTEDGEVHPGEVVEEKISLSERFGLWVSFYPFSQEEYLTITAQWLSSLGVSASAIAAARPEALVWALERGSRSGRVAYQFARDYAGKHSG